MCDERRELEDLGSDEMVAACSESSDDIFLFWAISRLAGYV
jgi:hypothetical protein